MGRSGATFFVGVCIVLALTGCLRAETTPAGDDRGQGARPAAAVTARVVRAIDGDTIEVELDGRRSRVRYIGLNTPESVDPNRPVECFGKEASARNRTLVEGRVVRLERDSSDTDDYGRLLRYVWVENGGREVLVNEVLVREGFARSRTYRPDVARQQQLDAAQRAARNEGRGLWSACPVSSSFATPRRTPRHAERGTSSPLAVYAVRLGPS